MGVAIRVKRGKLYLDTYYQGKRTWQALGLSLGTDSHTNKETLRVAEIIRQKRELQIASGEWGLIDPIEGKRTLVNYVEEFAIKQNPKNHLPKSLKYLKVFAKELKISNITERWLESYQDYLRDQGLGKATVSHYYQALKTVLNIAVRDRILPFNPADRVKNVSVPETVKVYLNMEEIQKLANTPVGGKLGHEVYLGFLFATQTGLRISDIKSLKWGDIHQSPLYIMKRMEKTGRVVNVPINENAWEFIRDEKQHQASELVFPTLAATQTNTNQYLVTWAKNAGVDKQIGWHTARHTFAVLSLEGGADFFTVSKMLGIPSL